jgi:tRNA threonylcarbamoyladenosine biosynthesis protein TsaE
MSTFISKSPSDNLVIAEKLLAAYPASRIFAFYGEMGAGKTTLIKDFCRVLGVTENTSSPTFALVNEYQSTNGKTIYHFDMYRIEDPSEAIRIGFEEYLESGNYCFIEWPEKINNLLPLGIVKVEVKASPEHRIISANE